MQAQFRTIDIDLEVHKALEGKRESLGESENDILHRVLLGKEIANQASPKTLSARLPVERPNGVIHDKRTIDLMAKRVMQMAREGKQAQAWNEIPESSQLAVAGVVVRLSSPKPKVERGFEFLGKFYSCRHKKDILIRGIELLARHTREPNFHERLAQIPSGRQRWWISRNRQSLYGIDEERKALYEAGASDKRPLADSYAEEIEDGWWVSTNYDAGKIGDGVRAACRVAGYEYGKDFVPKGLKD